jgi:hypothetical protein
METATALKAYLEDGDKPTGAQFTSLIDSLRHYWEDFIYFGVAIPTTTPAYANRQGIYLAQVAGTYTGFGSLVVAEGEVAALKFTVTNFTSGAGVWSKEVIKHRVEAHGITFIQQGGEDGVTIPAAIDLICETSAVTPTYQWQGKGTTAAAWVDLTAETAATLTMLQDSAHWGVYSSILVRCVVTSATQAYYSNVVNINKSATLTSLA